MLPLHGYTFRFRLEVMDTWLITGNKPVEYVFSFTIVATRVLHREPHSCHFVLRVLFSGNPPSETLWNWIYPCEHPKILPILNCQSAQIIAVTCLTTASATIYTRELSLTLSSRLKFFFIHFTTQLWRVVCDKEFLPDTGCMSSLIYLVECLSAHKPYHSTLFYDHSLCSRGDTWNTLWVWYHRGMCCHLLLQTQTHLVNKHSAASVTPADSPL